MNNLQIFNSAEFGEIRTVTIGGEPWFVAKDICEVLKHTNPTVAMQMLEEDERTKVSLGRAGETNVINESGLYALIIKSNLPSAKKFRKWVTSEVLPSIRRTGTYNLPGTYKEALIQLVAQVEENEKLALENSELKPKAEFFDAVADSKTAFSMQEVAKVLAIKGYGRNNLFEFLRNEEILDRYNVPYQRYVDCGWFRVIEQKYMRDGEPCVSTKTLVYQKGVDAIRKRIMQKTA
ncbi:MAG: phage antirepressor [Lachnospiraceae bacterium]|nr:phage antirepressor [Lachnospiraceae bacterium]